MMIDLVIQIAIFVAILLGIIALGSAAGPVRHAASADAWSQSFAQAFIAFIIFIVFFGYFILFEALAGGRTPGKMLMKIRTVRDGGYAIDFSASLIRNLIRAAEFVLGFYALSAAACLLSSENKRLGDMAAGTIVVREARAASLTALQSDAQSTRQPLLTAQEHAVVERFLARRDSLESNVRGLLAARIVDQIRPKLPDELRRLADEDILERVSVW